MAGLVVKDDTHHRLCMLSAELNKKKQDIADFLVRSAIDLSLTDVVVERLRLLSDSKEIPLADVIPFLLKEYANGK